LFYYWISIISIRRINFFDFLRQLVKILHRFYIFVVFSNCGKFLIYRHFHTPTSKKADYKVFTTL